MTVTLEDLAGWTDEDIKKHIASNYAGDVSGFNYGSPSEAECEALLDELKIVELILAYESVGSWGCDSSSFFLFRKNGVLYENHGGHCSCYGFEGQWEPEEVTVEALKKREWFSLGGYDNAPKENEQAIRDCIASLKEETN